MGHRASVSRAVAAVIEALSARICLSVTLADSTLTIDGTPGDDAVILAADKVRQRPHRLRQR